MRLFLDIEVYKNYFLALFMNEAGQVKRFEIVDDDASGLHPDKVLKLLTSTEVEIVTFNGNHYDIPILTYALVNQDAEMIKWASDQIIEKGVRPWAFYRNEGLKEPKVNHIDLKEVAPGMSGLKIYGGRLGTKWLKELPVDPSESLDHDQIQLLRKYCRNDTLLTQELFNSLSGELELRRSMSEEYGVDLRSKSDAQIAEAVLKTEFLRLTGEMPSKATEARRTFKYVPPAYIKFFTPDLQEALQVICDARMIVNEDTGHVKMPKAVDSLRIEIGGSRYKVGIGGLHSQESEIAHRSDENTLLLDRDVASYYPTMMLNMNMQPGGFGKHFNPVYKRILDARLVAKRGGDMVKSDSLKIVLNGTFGKTSSKYSTLYSPDFMIRTTVTGQLSILMLIEALEQFGISVVSANTDGIVIKCRVDQRDALNAIVAKWEKRTGLETEETVYEALYSRDVNNYIAVKEGGGAKTKGVYGAPSLRKNPQNTICSEAVVAFLTKGVPVSDTVRGCKDIQKFITLRTVTGGAVKDGEVLGKAIRWYYGEGVKGTINYVKNGNVVPRSRGAKPFMDFSDRFPDDVDYEWYIKEAEEILMAVGAEERPFVEKIPRKNSNAWKALRDEGRIVEGDDGKWSWAQ